MIGDNSKRIGTAKNASKSPTFVRAIFSLDGKPLDGTKDFVTLAFDSNIIQTRGDYSMQYKPYFDKSYSYAQRKPFLIKADFLPQIGTNRNKEMIRVESYDELLEIAKKDKYIAWLVNWTTLTRNSFDWVQGNPGLFIYFTPDYDRIMAHLIEQGYNGPINRGFVHSELSDSAVELKKEAYNVWLENYKLSKRVYDARITNENKRGKK